MKLAAAVQNVTPYDANSKEPYNQFYHFQKSHISVEERGENYQHESPMLQQIRPFQFTNVFP